MIDKIVTYLKILIHRNSGLGGFKTISDTTKVVGSFYAIKAVNGAAVLDNTGTISSNGDNVVATHSIPEGDVLAGAFESVQLVSGIAYAYYRD